MLRPCRSRLRQSQGLAYLALLFVILTVSLVAANAVQMGSVQGQRVLEDELMYAGTEIQLALQRYARVSPRGSPRAPRSLEELLKDPRFPGTVRHLRRLYADPMTGTVEWGMVRDGQGLILGVHSPSTRAPLRVEGPRGIAPIDGKGWRSYQEWIFWGPLPAVRGGGGSHGLASPSGSLSGAGPESQTP